MLRENVEGKSLLSSPDSLLRNKVLKFIQVENLKDIRWRAESNVFNDDDSNNFAFV